MKNNIFKVLVCALLCGTSVQAKIELDSPIDAKAFRCCVNAYEISKNNFSTIITNDQANEKLRKKDENGHWQPTFANWQAYIDSLQKEESKDFVKKYMKRSYLGRSWACSKDRVAGGRLSPRKL